MQVLFVVLFVVVLSQAAGWQLETRHFFDEPLPHGWSGDGMILSNAVRPNLLRFMFGQAPRQPTVLLDRNHAGMRVAAHVHENPVQQHLAGAAHQAEAPTA